MSHSLTYKGLCRGFYGGVDKGVIKQDTRSLDYSSNSEP